MSGDSRRDHYSYKHYADPDTARSFDQRRFGGAIGRLIASEQARVLANMVGRIKGRPILDVGTGTGRAAILMARGGAHVTAVDPSEEMLAIARSRAAEESLAIEFAIGDAHRLAFPDKAFDVVISLRVLMHAVEWQQALSELCRVAGRLVIIDYPAARSVALFQAAGRRLFHAVGVRNEPYRVFTHGAVKRELARSGFRIRSVHRQFVLPIAVHKAIGSRRFSTFTRAVSDRVGLLRLFGSPVTLVAERWTL